MKERIILQDARAEGKEEGRKKGGAYRDAEKIEYMLRNGKTVKQIVDFCGYTYEQVKEVEKSILQTVE